MAKTLEGVTLRIAPDVEEPQTLLSELHSSFGLVKSSYGSRNTRLENLQLIFNGAHWDTSTSENDDEDQFRLVFNYCRRVVLDFAGMMARSPAPVIPLPAVAEDSSPLLKQARSKEDLLRLVWKDLLVAWRKVELNATKLGHGVLQIVMDTSVPVVTPPERQAIGQTLKGETPDLVQTVKPPAYYTKAPLKFRSIHPSRFYPVYRTFDTPDDFLYVYRYDPGRLTKEIELRYNVSLSETSPKYDSAEPTCNLIEYWDDKYYVLIAEASVKVRKDSTAKGLVWRQKKEEVKTTLTVLHVEKHDYGRVPFWVLQNIEDPEYCPVDTGSLSDMEDIDVLNMHYNLLMSEQAEEIVTSIHTPLIYSSPSHSQAPSDLEYKAGAVFPIRDDESLSRLETSSQPSFVDRHIADVKQGIRELSFLGDAGFGDMPAGTSGVAARIAMTPMERILELKLPHRHYVLESVGTFLLTLLRSKLQDRRIKGWVSVASKRYQEIEIRPEDLEGDVTVFVEYGNMLPRDDMAYQQNEAYKYSAGTQSLETTLENMGLADPTAELQRLERERKNYWLNPAAFMASIEAKAAADAQEAQAKAQEQQQQQQPQQPGFDQAQMSTRPPVPYGQQFPPEQGYGPSTLAPYLQNMPAVPGQPLQPQRMGGPGINIGGLNE